MLLLKRMAGLPMVSQSLWNLGGLFRYAKKKGTVIATMQAKTNSRRWDVRANAFFLGKVRPVMSAKSRTKNKTCRSEPLLKVLWRQPDCGHLAMQGNEISFIDLGVVHI
jgi:hypothetical protein